MEMDNLQLEKVKKAYFIGIGGIGISAIAKYMHGQGIEVRGSDLKPSNVTERLESLGLSIRYGQKAENITDDIDLVVYTTSIPETNPELQAVREKGLRAITYAQSLGLVFNEKNGIAVCGTHGKSTTTAMIGAVLEDGGVDPSVLVGSIVPRYDGNLHVGGGDYFLAEACEYNHNFLSLYPHVIVLGNIELDHTDCYGDIGEMKEGFLDFLRHLPEEGMLLANGDDANVREVAGKIKEEKPRLRVVFFGSGEGNDFRFQDYRVTPAGTEFEAFRGRESLGKFALRVPGEFNVRNALAAIALAVQLDIPAEDAAASLEKFTGIWRRFEIKGSYRGALVVSDYAHHPTAVRKTIGAAKEFYPTRRLLAVFQPHQHNRTRGLYQDFLGCFDAADEVVLAEIYDVAGREEKEDQTVSSADMARDIQARNERLRGHITYAKDLAETERLIGEMVRPGDVVLIMGAGDIVEVAERLATAA
jgi:UDP-N-acetylmuramate--alanine ligase